MRKLNVFQTVKNIPKEANTISPKWVFKYKRNPEGKIIKRKARLVAKGFTQRFGVDYTATFSTTLKQDSLRVLIAIAVQKNFKIEQIDIQASYLNSELSEGLYLKTPKGHPSYNKSFWKLKKALYGLKQAGRAWNIKLNDTILKIDFRRLNSEPCVYVNEDRMKNIICMLLVYVDDIIIAG